MPSKLRKHRKRYMKLPAFQERNIKGCVPLSNVKIEGDKMGIFDRIFGRNKKDEKTETCHDRQPKIHSKKNEDNISAGSVNLGSLGTSKSVQGIAETWLRYYLDGTKGHVDKDKEWAVLELYDLSLKEPAQAWEVVQFINSKNISDENMCKLIDTIVGGSPLANILYACNDSLWKSILAAAAESTRLCRQLREIVEDSVDDAERWQELSRFLAQQK